MPLLIFIFERNGHNYEKSNSNNRGINLFTFGIIGCRTRCLRNRRGKSTVCKDGPYFGRGYPLWRVDRREIHFQQGYSDTCAVDCGIV